MTKKIIKITLIILLLIMFSAILTQSVFALSNVKAGFNKAEGNISPDSSSGIYEKTNNVINVAIGVMQLVGVGIAVIMLIVLAIKYMSAAPGDRADIKKHAVVYVVGAVVLFGAAGILGIIRSFAEKNI